MISGNLFLIFSTNDEINKGERTLINQWKYKNVGSGRQKSEEDGILYDVFARFPREQVGF
jgi:hypothetical protein